MLKRIFLVQIPEEIEYKYIIKNLHDDHSIEWEPGQNRILRVPHKETDHPQILEVRDQWDNKMGQNLEFKSVTKKYVLLMKS